MLEVHQPHDGAYVAQYNMSVWHARHTGASYLLYAHACAAAAHLDGADEVHERVLLVIGNILNVLNNQVGGGPHASHCQEDVPALFQGHTQYFRRRLLTAL